MFGNVCFMRSTLNRGSNQSQNKTPEIKQSSSAGVPFTREYERKQRKPFVLRNGFMLTYSSGKRCPECASSIHTTISTRPGVCQVSRSYVSACAPLRRAAKGFRPELYRADGDALRTSGRDKSPPRRRTQSAMFCSLRA